MRCYVLMCCLLFSQKYHMHSQFEYYKRICDNSAQNSVLNSSFILTDKCEWYPFINFHKHSTRLVHQLNDFYLYSNTVFFSITIFKIHIIKFPLASIEKNEVSTKMWQKKITMSNSEGNAYVRILIFKSNVQIFQYGFLSE